MTPGISRHSGHVRLGRHRHRRGYVALVLAGAYTEAGDCGRLRVSAGSVLIHHAYSAHLDDFAGCGAEVLNLPLPAGLGEGIGRIADVDLVVRLAERDMRAAAEAVARMYHAVPEQLDDWPDQLARDLAAEDGIVLAEWAARISIAPQSLSRGFRRAYGVTPKRYRLEQRARRAAAAAPLWRGSLAALAAECGFADQAHMTRAVRTMTGASVGALEVQSVQA